MNTPQQLAAAEAIVEHLVIDQGFQLEEIEEEEVILLIWHPKKHRTFTVILFGGYAIFKKQYRGRLYHASSLYLEHLSSNPGAWLK